MQAQSKPGINEILRLFQAQLDSQGGIKLAYHGGAGRRQGSKLPPGAEAALRGRYAAKPSLSDSQGAQARAELGGCNGQKWLLSRWPNNPLRPSPDSPYL